MLRVLCGVGAIGEMGKIPNLCWGNWGNGENPQSVLGVASDKFWILSKCCNLSKLKLFVKNIFLNIKNVKLP